MLLKRMSEWPLWSAYLIRLVFKAPCILLLVLTAQILVSLLDIIVIVDVRQSLCRTLKEFQGSDLWKQASGSLLRDKNKPKLPILCIIYREPCFLKFLCF